MEIWTLFPALFRFWEWRNDNPDQLIPEPTYRVTRECLWEKKKNCETPIWKEFWWGCVSSVCFDERERVWISISGGAVCCRGGRKRREVEMRIHLWGLQTQRKNKRTCFVSREWDLVLPSGKKTWRFFDTSLAWVARFVAKMWETLTLRIPFNFTPSWKGDARFFTRSWELTQLETSAIRLI